MSEVYPSQWAPIPIGDLENWNIDRTVEPLTMVRGGMHKTSAGVWDYDDGRSYLYRSDGTEVFQMLADGMPRVISQSYYEQIAEGNIAGHTPWSKIGYNPAVTTSEEDIWSAGGIYVYPVSAIKCEVVSDDNTQDIGTIIKGDATGNTVQSDAGGSTTTLVDADVDFTAVTAVGVGDLVILDPHGTTPEWGYVSGVATHTLTLSNGFSSGGTGASRYYAVIDKSAKNNAQVVKIEYLDGSYAQKSEIVVLNGTTAVDTINADYFRINSFRIIGAGSNGVSLGNIILRADGAGNTYSYIGAGFTRARNTMYTVPAGKTLYINMWQVGAATPNDVKVQTVRVFTKANREPSTGFGDGLFYTYTELLINNETASISFPIPTKLIAKTDLKVAAVGLTGFSGPVTTVLRGWLE